MSKKPTELGRVRDHLGHAYDNIDQAISDMDEAARTQQSAVQKLKNAKRQVGWANRVSTPSFRAEPQRKKAKNYE